MQTWELLSHIPRNDTCSLCYCEDMKLKELQIIFVYCGFLCFPQESLLQRRQCAFHVNNKTNLKNPASGDVNGNVQHCKNTSCCEARYKIINKQLKLERLACSVLPNEPCLEKTCKIPNHFRDPYVRCLCNTDLCNSNITLTSKQTLHTHSFSAAEATKTVMAVVLCSSCIIILALSWRKLCEEKTKVKNQNEEENLQSCNIQPSCSCQTKAPESNITDFELQEVVGRGCFATVFQGRYKNSVVAVKVYSAGLKHKFTTEKEIYELPLMGHSGIVQFLGAGRKPDDGSWVIVLQYAEFGSLHSFLCKHTSSWRMSLKLCQSLSQGLSYLHSDLLSHGLHKPPVAHRDLSSFNVLVKADGTCALCDFGSSTVLRFCSDCHFWQNHVTMMKGQAQFGTLHYMPPEVLDGSVNLSSSSFLMQGDIYALGLILWEIWMRCSDLFEGGIAPQRLLPYQLELKDSVTLEKLFLFVSEMDNRPSIPDYWGVLPQGSAIKELLTDCWDRDTDARLTALCVVNRLVSLTSSYPH